MGWQPKNYVESLLPLMTVYAIIGHDAFRYPALKTRVGFSICYTIVVLIAIAILFYFTYHRALKFNYDTMEEKLFFTICTLNAVIVLCTGTLSWYHYNMRMNVVQRIMTVDETLTKLGADCQHSKTYRSSILCLMIHLALIVTLNTIDMLWVIDKYNVFEIFWIVAVLHLPYHVSNYVLMNCTLTLRGVATRFRIMNKVLTELLKQNGRKEGRANKRVLRRNTHRIDQIRVASRENVQKHIVQIIKQVHLEVCGISESLNTIYGVQIVLQFGAYFIFFTILGYDLYVIYMNPTFVDRTRRICTLSFWFFIHLMKIFVVNHMAASVICEACKTQEIVEELNIMADEPDVKDELRQFSLQMIQSTLSFTPMGFFTLGYGLVSSILGTVATYLVILIQTNIIPEFMLENNK